MISLRAFTKLVRESHSLIWPVAPTDVERVEAAVRWLRDELDDMKDRGRLAQSAGAGSGCAGPPVVLDAPVLVGVCTLICAQRRGTN